jgi:hypothetical protein
MQQADASRPVITENKIFCFGGFLQSKSGMSIKFAIQDLH